MLESSIVAPEPYHYWVRREREAPSRSGELLLANDRVTKAVYPKFTNQAQSVRAPAISRKHHPGYHDTRFSYDSGRLNRPSPPPSDGAADLDEQTR